MGRPLILPRTAPQETLVLAAVGLAIGIAVVAPFAALAVGVISDPGALGRALAMLGSAEAWSLMARSVGIAAAATALCLAIGVPLAMLLGACDVPGSSGILLVHTFPLFLPPFLLALGWFQLFGRQGFVGGEMSARFLFSVGGVVLVHALAFAPVVTSLVALGLRGAEPSLEEAARMSAGPGRVAVRILLPLARPAVVLAALVVFALSLSDLGAPMLLRVRVYPEAVFARLGGMQYAPGEAFALALPLLVPAILLLGVERRFVRGDTLAVLRLRRRDSPPLALGRWRASASAACTSVAALSVMPVAGLALRAGLGRGFGAVPEWIGSSLWSGLGTAALAATVITTIGLAAGWALARGRPFARIFDAVTVLAFVTPAAVLGVGLVAVWNRPRTQAVYASAAILVLGYVARYAVLGLRTISSAVLQSSRHLEDAAASFGAGFLRVLARVVLPVNASAVAAAWLLALAFCLRDLETVVLFYPPGREPLPVRIFTLEANGPEPVVCALAVLHALVTAAALGTGAFFLLRRRRP